MCRCVTQSIMQRYPGRWLIRRMHIAPSPFNAMVSVCTTSVIDDAWITSTRLAYKNKYGGIFVELMEE